MFGEVQFIQIFLEEYIDQNNYFEKKKTNMKRNYEKIYELIISIENKKITLSERNK